MVDGGVGTGKMMLIDLSYEQLLREERVTWLLGGRPIEQRLTNTYLIVVVELYATIQFGHTIVLNMSCCNDRYVLSWRHIYIVIVESTRVHSFRYDTVSNCCSSLYFIMLAGTLAHSSVTRINEIGRAHV